MTYNVSSAMLHLTIPYHTDLALTAAVNYFVAGLPDSLELFGTICRTRTVAQEIVIHFEDGFIFNTLVHLSVSEEQRCCNNVLC